MINEINHILSIAVLIVLILAGLKSMLIGPCHLFGYFFNQKYREEFHKWMMTAPKYKNYKRK
jgi:hypothetical protein